MSRYWWMLICKVSLAGTYGIAKPAFNSNTRFWIVFLDVFV